MGCIALYVWVCPVWEPLAGWFQREDETNSLLGALLREVASDGSQLGVPASLKGQITRDSTCGEA